MSILKPCPFCGKTMDTSDQDTIYPSGIGWMDRQHGRSYHSFREVPPKQWCYEVVCQTTAGGCNASITADSKEDAIAKWNTRTPEK